MNHPYETDEPKRMLSSKEISDVLVEISKTGASVALCGGAALHCYGGVRLTVDVDVLAEEPLPGYDSGPPVSFGGYQTEIAGAPVDVIIRADGAREYYEAALANAHRIKGVPIPVVTPEFMALLKLHARRRKDELDLEALILSGHIDPQKSKMIFREYLGPGGLDEFAHVWREVKLRRALDEAKELGKFGLDEEPER